MSDRTPVGPGISHSSLSGVNLPRQVLRGEEYKLSVLSITNNRVLGLPKGLRDKLHPTFVAAPVERCICSKNKNTGRIPLLSFQRHRNCCCHHIL